MTPRTLHEIDIVVHLIQKELADLSTKFAEDSESVQENLERLQLRVAQLETFQARLLSTLGHARTALVVLCFSSAPTAYKEIVSILQAIGVPL